MADYNSPTVITPTIPVSDMTELERLILTTMFDHEYDGDRIYFFSNIGPSEIISIDRDDLLGALERSVTTPGGTALSLAIAALRREDREVDATYLDIDVSETPWTSILHDIVWRSSLLDEIVVTTCFTCTRMRSAGFGGSVTRITPEGISSRSTLEMLAALRADWERHGAENVAHCDHDARAPWPSRDPITRMVLAIDEQARNPNPFATYLLDRGDTNSLATIRRFVASFRDPRDALRVATGAELEAALCVWEAMLELRRIHEDEANRDPVHESIHEMLNVWDAIGSHRMRRFALDIAGLALQVFSDLQHEIADTAWAFDSNIVPAVVENLDWSFDGPERRGEPELFLHAVLDTLRRTP